MADRPSARQLREWDRRYLWHPFTQMQEWEQEEPLVIERGKGSYLIDTEGRRYLDGTSSIWVNLHGHRHPVLDRALKGQIDKIAHSTLLGLSNPPAILLARELIKVAPPGLSRVFYSDDGSTAVEVALKMAVQYWRQRHPDAGPKSMFLRLKLAYHGDTIGAVSVGNIELFHARFKPLLFPTLEAEPPSCYRCPLGLTYPSCKTACLEPIERILQTRHRDLAGFIVEPLIQAAAGMIIQPPGYLARLRELCTRYNVLLIADEVATGFGRTGKMFACEHDGVTPDLMAVSKGLTGGYLPLAATLTTDEIYRAFLGRYEEFKTFFHGHSYTGNPLGCAVALANLEVFRRQQVLRSLGPKISLLQKLLASLAGMPSVGDIRQQGLMAGIELVQDKMTKEPYPPPARIGHRVATAARARGLLIRPLGNVVVLVPPLSVSREELTRMVEIVRESIDTLSAG
ncbi:adenosylmethionine--8-amino-7-oxononanoate transaminase [Nitrospira moscoviensis]|uniref:Adenosylmethionine-8-amino-7-oxononanoate aminotransferase n=1 Tax=Nitrospira moscoviensis TaxID=42253 RepID=A0A0K2GFS8_NITMO|nr:adenosylmethionine--8-amino-7-oxononanoate transaminase [Nitrospira moscoviensis]ALA59709.1 Adenosylmethionine-8-amino-7-oxononanoate aminotransferase [Nitrospira moscoviensis]